MAGLAIDNNSSLEWNLFRKKHLRVNEHKEDKENKEDKDYQEVYGSEYYGANEEDEEVEEDKEGKVLSF